MGKAEGEEVEGRCSGRSLAGPRNPLIHRRQPRSGGEMGAAPWREMSAIQTPARSETTAAASPLTIDAETVPVQGEGAQQGASVRLTAQLPVQLLCVQPGAHRARMEGAEDVHSGSCPVLLGPGEGRTWGRGMMGGIPPGVDVKGGGEGVGPEVWRGSPRCRSPGTTLMQLGTKNFSAFADKMHWSFSKERLHFKKTSSGFHKGSTRCPIPTKL